MEGFSSIYLIRPFRPRSWSTELASPRRWPKLAPYSKDFRNCRTLPNCRSEYCIRRALGRTERHLTNGEIRALGRKNWIFAGADEGGLRAAVIYTLIETAKINRLDPEAYLHDVLARIADHRSIASPNSCPGTSAPPLPFPRRRNQSQAIPTAVTVRRVPTSCPSARETAAAARRPIWCRPGLGAMSTGLRSR